MDLKELKDGFGKLEKKYGLPCFKDLNENFEIDRIERETDTLIREVRKVMMDKIIGYTRFLEMMLNPSSAPPMFMMFLKDVTKEDKGVIEKVYKSYVELELKALKLEIDYDEKKESDMVKDISKTWNGMKKDMESVLGVMEKNWNMTSKKKEKSYFG
jgi:hypothetical protein